MAPARKKGANKVKSANELRLGDLVLAKVKGFPAWPAKVSRPEDWERAPDSKKYFVQFFGTQEIAFVAPPDVQAFTSESKNKLLARCKGKTVKYFAQAVKEICEAFEQLRKSDLSSRADNAAACGHDAYNIEAGNVNGSHAELRKRPKSEEVYASDYVLDNVPGLGGCPSVKDLLKPAAAAEESKKSGDYSEMLQKDTDTGRDFPTVASVRSALVPSSVKEEIALGENKADTVIHLERIESSKASSSSPYSSHSDIKRVNHHGDGKRDTLMSLGPSGHKLSAGGNKKSANGHKSLDMIAGAKRKIEGVIRQTDDAKSGVLVKDRIPGKLSAGIHAKRLSSGVNKSESSPRGKVLQSLLKEQKLVDVGKYSPQDAVAASKECGDAEYSRRKDRQISQEQSPSVKKAKHVHIMCDTAKGSIIKSEKSDLEPEISSEEAAFSVTKRHRRALEATSDANISSEDKRSLGLRTGKSDVPKKRRAVCLVNDDDDDDEPKTPVHGRTLSASKVGSSAVIPDSTKKTDENHASLSSGGETLKVSIRDGGGSQKDCLSSGKLVGQSSISATMQLKVDNTKAHVSHSPGKEELDKRLVKEGKMDLLSPAKSPLVAAVVKRMGDQQKSNRMTIKGSSSLNSNSKAQNVPGKDSRAVSGGSNSSQSQVSSQKSRQPLSGERAKSFPKMLPGLSEPYSSVDNQKDHDPAVVDERLEDAKDRSGSVADSKALDSAMSIRHLIAAAQAKRRQANIQTVPQGNGDSVLVSTTNLHGNSPSPLSRGPDIPSAMDEVDAQGAHLRGSCGSPPAHIGQLASHDQLDSEEPEIKGPGSGHQAAGSTLSGGTEAAVARDAFEGMIETLSRTKESIGRATRLAIDCAKYGIANEVVELLIHKLENEPNFHRRVDLFFLVDSITQCSHSQKGIAGASYIPIVQAALPRLLGAAAPFGANARENRRQCLKVLRLWLERKILPEAVLRRFMDDIGSSNDEMSSGISFRRPSRAERSVDDPIREMEGMLVDEYGSNATFNLPGFLSAHGFVDDDEDEEENGVPSTSLKQSDASPMQPSNNSAGLDISKDTPNDRRHHILEEVDGELEMEDVCLKDGATSPSGSSKKDKQEMKLDTQLEYSTNDFVGSPSLDGSPPLPFESPPPLPPLPTSPPPPPPPPLSPSPPPPPPPLTLPSHIPPPSLVSSGPLQASILQPVLHPQASMAPRVVLLPPSVVPPMQAPLPPDYSIPTGSHPVQIACNTPQQVPCFPAGASGSHDTPGYSSVYAVPLAGPSNQQFQQNQQFQPSQATFVQRAFPPVTMPQPPAGHFAYKPTPQQQMPQPRSHPPPPPAPCHPYTSASHSEGLRRFGDEQWISASAEYKTDSQHNSWMNGGRMPSCPPTNFMGEAYFRPPERALADSMGYQVSAPVMTGPTTSGHGINQMLPSRPDMSSLNWRPA